MTDHQARVREVAYHLWEFHGRPEGRDVELWLAAERWVMRDEACRSDHARRAITFPRGRADQAMANAGMMT